jgi:hypothetical protein
MKCFKIVYIIAAASILAAGTMSGCTKKPSQDELSKLDEAKAAAENAEKKLYELKQERMRLESDLQQKQGDLRKSEDERNTVKQKTGK